VAGQASDGKNVVPCALTPVGARSNVGDASQGRNRCRHPERLVGLSTVTFHELNYSAGADWAHRGETQRVLPLRNHQYDSQLERYTGLTVVSYSPPATSTAPFDNSVAVCKRRAAAILPADAHVFVAGS
jgi:hypothetical protein